MKRLTGVLGGLILAVAVLALFSQRAQAGRVGGPMSNPFTLEAYQSVTFDVPFFAGERAIVSIAGTRSANVELLLTDGDGHVVVGTGIWDRKTAAMDVYRAGTLRIEVRNLSPVADPMILSTN